MRGEDKEYNRKLFEEQFPIESQVNVLRSDGTISQGVVLDYELDRRLIFVGLEGDECYMLLKGLPYQQLVAINPEGSRLAESVEKVPSFCEIGDEINIKRSSGELEKARVIAISPSGKYIKVRTKGNTWKWFIREAL